MLRLAGRQRLGAIHAVRHALALECLAPLAQAVLPGSGVGVQQPGIEQEVQLGLLRRSPGALSGSRIDHALPLADELLPAPGLAALGDGGVCVRAGHGCPREVFARLGRFLPPHLAPSQSGCPPGRCGGRKLRSASTTTTLSHTALPGNPTAKAYRLDPRAQPAVANFVARGPAGVSGRLACRASSSCWHWARQAGKGSWSGNLGVPVLPLMATGGMRQLVCCIVITVDGPRLLRC